MKTSYPIPGDLSIVVERALQEDVGNGDLTSSLLNKNKISTASITCKEKAVMCGIPWFNEVYRQLDPEFEVTWHVMDGDFLQDNTRICTLKGPVRIMLTGERTALNFIQLLSGTATKTQECVQLIKHSVTQLLDTRKTIPGLRTAQKYAVLCGGGKNHRMGLYDAILIKENHISAAGDIASAYKNAMQIHKNVEIEVEDLAELQQALDVGATKILLDNFDLDMIRQAVEINAGQAQLEVSGGIDAHIIGAIAETGIDCISIGALTKNIRAIDFSMKVTT